MPKVPHERFYLNSFSKYNYDAKSLNWASKENQILRFEKIYEAIKDDIKTATIVDVGCGFGDFYLFLKRKNTLPKKYIGIEILKEFADIAKKNTSATIINADFLTLTPPKATYYICSGALNTLDKFESYLFIQKALKYATKGFVFNFLYGDKESDMYNYISKEELKKLIKGYKIFYKASNYIKNDMTVGICVQSLES
jgi:SAM-dependent methyltransferase